MKRILALIFLSATLGQANDEITIELPGRVPLETVWIEPGSFTMGSREITISQGFYLGKYEITQEQWQAVMGTEPWSSAPGDYQGPRHPAIGISWYDAQAFAQRLNDYFGEDTYRLPTEAEWEYACRAGTTTRWSFGNDESLLASYAWYEANAGDAGVQPVGTKLPNSWGLFDMYGNAEEWVHNWYDYDRHFYDDTPQTDPSGPISGHYRILRGGSYFDSAINASSASSIGAYPEFGHYITSARLLKGAPLNLVIPERIPFPQNSSGPFFPVHEGNIWIMASHRYGYGPPSVDTTAYVLESHIIEGKQYWSIGLTGFGGWPFRVDESGDIWFRTNSYLSGHTRHFLQALDDNPELRESQYYQQYSLFKNLDPEQEDFLIYDFDVVVLELDPDSPTWDIDQQFYDLLYALLIVRKVGEPAPDQRLFGVPGPEWDTTQTFQRGIGIVREQTTDVLFPSTTDSELIWARINGKEYGLHPGPGYPGYREVITAVASSELPSAHPATSRLSPNFPNPFNASTQIAYHLATPGRVRLKIYNTLGQPVRTLVDQFQSAGSYQVRWDAGTALAAGIYLVRLHYPGGEQTRRLLLLK